MKSALILSILLLSSPLAVSADGQADFAAHCAKCHGGNAKTVARRALLMKVEPAKLYLAVSKLKQEEVLRVVENGRGKMPAFGKTLSKEQKAAVVDYVVKLRDKE